MEIEQSVGIQLKQQEGDDIQTKDNLLFSPLADDEDKKFDVSLDSQIHSSKSLQYLVFFLNKCRLRC